MKNKKEQKVKKLRELFIDALREVKELDFPKDDK